MSDAYAPGGLAELLLSAGTVVLRVADQEQGSLDFDLIALGPDGDCRGLSDTGSFNPAFGLARRRRP